MPLVELAKTGVFSQEVSYFLSTEDDRVRKVIFLIAYDRRNREQALDKKACLAEGTLGRVRNYTEYNQLSLILDRHGDYPVKEVVPLRIPSQGQAQVSERADEQREQSYYAPKLIACVKDDGGEVVEPQSELE